MNRFPVYNQLKHDASPYHAIFNKPKDEYYNLLEKQEDNYEVCSRLFGLKAKIWKAEALTLFELAYHVQGPVLELGCFQGASTIVLCKANRDVTTIDISEEALEEAKKNFKKFNVNPRVIKSDAALGIDLLSKENKKFKFVFIDHDHSYDNVFRVCEQLPKVIQNYTYLYFHDFQDLRNETKEYGVYKAVQDTLKNSLIFLGLSGNGAIFQYRQDDLFCDICRNEFQDISPKVGQSIRCPHCNAYGSGTYSRCEQMYYMIEWYESD